MKSANIAELKNRLSHFLRFVRRGETVLVRDREKVIARIDPVRELDSSSIAEAERVAGLVSRGVLLPPRRRSARVESSERPRVKADLVAAVLAERDEGR